MPKIENLFIELTDLDDGKIPGIHRFNLCHQKVEIFQWKCWIFVIR